MSRKKGGSRRPVKIFVFLILILIFSAYALMFAEDVIRPSLSSIAEVKVKAVISQMVQEAVNKKFSSGVDMKQLLLIEKDAEGKVSFVQSNTVAMNQISSELAMMIQERLRDMEPAEVKISMGSLVGSQIFSQAGPMVDLKIVPVGMTKVNFKTEFESTGVNQTRYKIFLETETQARVIVPFSNNYITLGNIVPIAETVIVGDAPENYVMVPSNEVIDGLQLAQ